MIKEQNIVLSGGMNSDDDDKAMPQGDYRNLENLRTGLSVADNEGMAESLPSPLQLTIDWKGTTVSNIKFIGSARDAANDVSYIFVHNVGSSGYSHIVEVSIDANGDAQAEQIFEDRYSRLNFNSNYPIYNARVFNGNIYFTDNNNQPMFINISKAKKYMEEDLNETDSIFPWDDYTTFSIGDLVYFGKFIYRCNTSHQNQEPPNASYWDEVCEITETYLPNWDLEDVLFIATPPVNSPYIKYQTDSSKLSNALRGNQYQFAYRWIYYDFRKTVFGPASEVLLPEGEETVTGVLNEDISTNNMIRVRADTGPASVISLEVIYRSSKDLSTWYRLAYVDKYDSEGKLILDINGFTYLYFYDDLAPLAVSDAEVYKPFHYVPQKAGFLEIIEGNNMVFGKCTEGYPPISLDVEVEKSLETISGSAPVLNMGSGSAAKLINSTTSNAVQWIRLPYVPYVGSTYYVRTKKHGEAEKVANYTLNDGNPGTWLTTLRAGLQAAMNAQSMPVVSCTAGPCGYCNDYNFCFWAILYNHNYVTALQYYNIYGMEVEGWIEYSGNFMPKHLNLKEGATHGVAIVYYDSARRAGPANATEQMRFYLSYYQDDAGDGLLVNSKKWRIQLNISNLAPSWAEYYQVVYTGNLSMSYYIQSRIVFIGTETDYVEISINQYIDILIANSQNFKQDKYFWEAGDRFRLVGYFDAGEVYTELTEFIDLEVLGVDPEDDDVIRLPRFTVDGYDEYQILGTGNGCVVEIYRSKKSYDEDIFYEIAGLKFNIGTSNGYPIHNGDVDQVVDVNGITTTPCSIYLDSIHDGFKYERSAGGGNDYFASSQHLSDFYRPTNLTSLGFPKVEDETVKQIQLGNRLRYGGSLDLNTRNNQIADFEYDGYEDLPEKYGEINGLQEVGFVLKVLQSHRVWSIYVRRTSSFNPDGTESIFLTDTILGTKRPVSQEWGTQNPESVLVHERHMYFWDRSQNRFIRDSANGMEDLSDRKMRTFFRRLSNTYASCRTGINEGFDEVWCHFHKYPVSGVGGDYFTIIFSERRGRWVFKIIASLQIHRFFNIGNDMFYTMNSPNGIYHVDKGADFNDIGVIPSTNALPVIEVVVNSEADAVKIFKAIIQHCSHKMWAPTTGDIATPASDNYSLGMETRLLEGKVISQEGVYYGPVMMDNNTPEAAGEETSEENRIVNGRPMRGQVLRIRLTRTWTDEKIIYEELTARYINSKRT